MNWAGLLLTDVIEAKMLWKPDVLDEREGSSFIHFFASLAFTNSSIHTLDFDPLDLSYICGHVSAKVSSVLLYINAVSLALC